MGIPVLSPESLPKFGCPLWWFHYETLSRVASSKSLFA
ncbi:hypothetical protein KR50_26450 [Jeotgalibacillus campisalis]|uniref:Uncharacterized protein n=1 Tax=Jeotgalibacillus campisalis TaxID=220754 RepID=A0A0C2R6U5_9BACL|nr:hypothetical protein KR50_26450 [Jeotgalibacillus campisalis]